MAALRHLVVGKYTRLPHMSVIVRLASVWLHLWGKLLEVNLSVVEFAPILWLAASAGVMSSNSRPKWQVNL